MAPRRKFSLGVAVVLCVLMGLTPFVVNALTNGQAAAVVLGERDFTHSNGGTNATRMSFPEGVASDSSGNIWVVESNNNRVLEFLSGTGFTNGQAAAVVLGQPDFTHIAPATTATGLNDPTGVAVDPSGNVWVADYGNNRVVEYARGTGFTNGQAAAVVLGERDFTHYGGGRNATSMTRPTGVGTDSSGNVWVTDGGNNRILEFLKGTGFTNGQAAAVVLGQADFTHAAPALSQTGVYLPWGVAVDPSGNVWVTDNGNSRALEFLKGTGFTNGQAAAVVLGQPDFTHGTYATTATGMYSPEGIGVDSSGNVWVSDEVNNRVLEYVVGAGFTNGQAAALVLGQPSFTLGMPATTAAGMAEPVGVNVDPSGNVWVADLGNNRVLEFAGATTTTTTTTSSSTTSTTSSSTSASVTTAKLVCPSTGSGTLMPKGATFKDASGNVWLAPSGSGTGGYWSSYFFPGAQGVVPAPMVQGWGGVYGAYGGQSGWIVTFYC